MRKSQIIAATKVNEAVIKSLDGTAHELRTYGIILVFLLTFGLTRISMRAQDISPTGPEAGRNLAAELRSIRPPEEFKWSGILKILGRGRKSVSVPIACQTTLTATNWSVTYFASATESGGAEKLTVMFSTNGPNQYLFARASAPGAPLGEEKILTGAEADIPLAGSDFWLSDLGFEFYHWPDQVEQKGEMRRGRPCFVLESSNPHPAPGGYAKVVTWVDKDSRQPLLAEARGEDRKLMKEFEVGSVEKVHGNYAVKNLRMFNDKTGSRTELDFDLDDK